MPIQGVLAALELLAAVSRVQGVAVPVALTESAALAV
jgi:hypothetical protein